MTVPIAMIPMGARVRVRRGHLPTDGALIGRTGTVVERVTEALALRIHLPTYEEWSAAYAEAPERFEGELLGLWREDA